MTFKTTLPILAMIICFSSCDKTKSKIESESKIFKDKQNAKWDSITKLFNKDTSSFSFLHDVFGAASAPPTGPIDIRYAHLYASEYQSFYPASERRLIGVDSVDVDVTKSVWINKEAIYSFVETFMKNDSLDGIRLYFAKYTTNPRDPYVRKQDYGKNTIFFVVTKMDERDASIHRDFYNRSFSGTRTDGLYVYDYSSLCPTECKGGDFNH